MRDLGEVIFFVRVLLEARSDTIYTIVGANGNYSHNAPPVLPPHTHSHTHKSRTQLEINSFICSLFTQSLTQGSSEGYEDHGNCRVRTGIAVMLSTWNEAFAWCT